MKTNKKEALNDDGMIFCPKKKQDAYVWGDGGWLTCGACHAPLTNDLWHGKYVKTTVPSIIKVKVVPLDAI